MPSSSDDLKHVVKKLHDTGLINPDDLSSRRPDDLLFGLHRELRRVHVAATEFDVFDEA